MEFTEGQIRRKGWEQKHSEDQLMQSFSVNCDTVHDETSLSSSSNADGFLKFP